MKSAFSTMEVISQDYRKPQKIKIGFFNYGGHKSGLSETTENYSLTEPDEFFNNGKVEFKVILWPLSDELYNRKSSRKINS